MHNINPLKQKIKTVIVNKLSPLEGLSSITFVGSFESSSNQFIKSKSKVFFVTDELVKEMEDYLSKESLDAFINKSTSSDDLFN